MVMKNPKITYIFDKILVFLLCAVNAVIITLEYLKKKNVLKYQKFLVQLMI